MGKWYNSLFPLEGKCRAAAKGCTRLRVEKKRKGCPDRQTAGLGGVSFEALAVQHPRATTWPSPPQGGARFSGTISCFPLRGNAALAAKGCTRLRVEMKRKGCPDRQTAARLDGVSFEALAVQHPRATLWPSPPRWEACHLILSRLRLPANQVPLPPQGGARFSGTIPCFPLRGNAAQRQKGVQGCM